MSDAEGNGPQGPVDGAANRDADDGVTLASTTHAEGPDRRVRAIRRGPHDAIAPAPQAAPPKFSQPVRQVVLMLIVLGLVCAGGWLAYGRILSIFSVNPMLNGTIFAVFVFGVLTCFWQVGQLITSVSWIERFASRRRNAAEGGFAALAEAGGTPPRLLAPLAALLSSGGSGAISTASSRSILESVSARIDESRDITRYVSNLLIFLGLLGTFYGLAITVPAVVETIRALQPQEGESGLQVFDKLMSGLEGQLGGMGTAFSSSLLGLAGSLVVGLQELFATHGQNRFYRELEEWLSGFTRVDLAEGRGDPLTEGAVAGFLDQVAGQMADLHEYYLQRDAQRAAEAEASEARIRAMAQGIDGLAAQILEQGRVSGGQSDSALQAFASMAEGQARMAAGQERLTETLLDGRNAVPDTMPILVRLADGQDLLAGHLGAVPDTAAALARLADGQERLAATLLDSRNSVPDTTPILTRLADGQELLAGHLGSVPDTAAALARLADLLARLAEGQDRLAETLQRQPAADTAPLLTRLIEGQDRLAGQLTAAPAAGADTGPALALLAEGQARLIKLTERVPDRAPVIATPETASEQDQSDVIEARMHLRSIDYQLARLVEEMAAGRADMVGELREEMAALSRAIRLLGQGDAT